VVFLDDSTSAFYIVPYLAELKNIQVVTNGVDTLNVLNKHHITCYCSGGKIDPTNKSALIGEIAENMISSMFYDIMFFSLVAVNEKGIASDPSLEGNTLRRTAMKNSKKTVFLFDNEKFSKTSTFKAIDLNEVDVIISDLDVEKEIKREDLPEIICVKN
jgi:DeoR/GlpR family transcriptional regulator of sugar metabolism